MRRVVVTGMGIVSSIGNNTQEVLASLREAKSGIVARRKIRRDGLSLARCKARRRSIPIAMIDRRAHAFPRRRRGLEPCRHGSGDRRFGACAG